MSTLELNVQELSFSEVIQIEGGLHWGWYVGALGLGFATGTAIRVMA